MTSTTPPLQASNLPIMNPLPVSHLTSPVDEQLNESIIVEADDRSSSLSEIEDRGVTERIDVAPSANVSDGGDTEAETERLEESPQKTRSQQNVVLTATADLNDHRESQLDRADSIPNGQHQGNTMEDEKIPPTSDISSLGDSSDDSRTSPTSRKRKRPLYSPSPQHVLNMPTRAFGYVVNEDELEQRDQIQGSSSEIDGDDVQIEQEQESRPGYEVPGETATEKASPQKKLKGKRKAGGVTGPPIDDDGKLAADIGVMMGSQRTAETTYNNGGAVAVEGVADALENETAVKSEEAVVKKKTALNALGAIEQCFASLKEKLYDEKIARCDAELAMLASPTPNHPELLAALEVIDRHRDEKIRYEDTLVKYKLGALQRKSVAEKAQAHAQYMLRVQDIRETHLTNLNAQFYQIQHERRTTESTAQEYMYHFQPKRSDQIRRQAAYNKEVSLLSGIAKYVGFPAAPDIKGLKQNEIDEDLRAMGITVQPVPVAPVQPAIPRPSLPLSASFSKQKSNADERFLEQNPWANAQHPAHVHLQRQRSAISRPESPLVTPAPQKRVVDLTAPQGSASTIAEPLSGQNSSMAPTPATGEAAKSPNGNIKPNINSTPIKAPERIVLDSHDIPPKESKSDDTKPTTSFLSNSTLKQPSFSFPRKPSPNAPTSLHGNSLSNPLAIPDGPVPYTNSPIPRFPTVKVEERPAHSLLGHHALGVSTGPNGLGGGRFGGVV